MSIAAQFASSFFDEEVEMNYEQYCSMKKYVDFAESLKQNREHLEFILAHLFSGSSQDFKQFVNESIIKNNGEMIALRSEEKSSTIGQIVKESIIIAGIFWHDRFVFDFIKDIESFSPGFAKVISMEIEKVGEVNQIRPVIRALIQCEVFQKQR
jgi:hypothetical protein